MHQMKSWTEYSLNILTDSHCEKVGFIKEPPGKQVCFSFGRGGGGQMETNEIKFFYQTSYF